MVECVKIGDATLYCGDCLTVMREMQEGSVDLVCADPPYGAYKGIGWDREWRDETAFLAWIGEVVTEWARILRPGGSLYVFASARMAARVEMEIARHFEVLNHIVWRKPDGAGAEKGARGGLTRTYIPQSERIIFAEHRNPLGVAIKRAREMAGVSQSALAKEIAAKAGRSGKPTGLCGLWEKPRSYKGASEPTEDQFCAAMRFCGDGRQEQDIRDEYRKLRRVFRLGVDAPMGDVWDFAPVRPRQGKHPCEKPQLLLRHIIAVSSRTNDVVLDSFMGGGSTGRAAIDLGRRFIGIERDSGYFGSAVSYIDDTSRPAIA